MASNLVIELGFAAIVRKFARVVVWLVNEEQKQLVFTTHSEQFLLSLLARNQGEALSK
jgi:hypothetical protein